MNKISFRKNKHNAAKLTKDQVIYILKTYDREIHPYRYFAEMFNVSDNCIKNVIKRTTWNDVEI